VEKELRKLMVENSTRKSAEKAAKKFLRNVVQSFTVKIGSKGGSQRAKQHEGAKEAVGKTSLEEAGHRGGQRVRRLIQAGKEHEEE
jgi:hypothetical protein